MDNPSPLRVSALLGTRHPGIYGNQEGPGLELGESANLTLHQVAFWTDTEAAVKAKIATAIGAETTPGPGQAVIGKRGCAIRIEPMKYWILETIPPTLTADEGSVVELSHARTCLNIGGEKAAELLNHFLPIDLRDAAFPANAVASTALHHVAVTLWRRQPSYRLFVPRGFALSLWELLFESGLQYGVEVR